MSPAAPKSLTTQTQAAVVRKGGWYLPGLLLIASLLVLWLACGDWQASSRGLQAAQQNLAECQQMARKLSLLASSPRIATLELDSPQELIERVTDSLARAGVPESALVSVTPAAAVRVSQSNYQQRETELQVRDVSLAMLASFHDALGQGHGLYLRDLRLQPAVRSAVATGAAAGAANASNVAENWDARLTLTQLIYSPKSP